MLNKTFVLGFACLILLLQSCIKSDEGKSGYKIEDGQVVFYRGYPVKREVVKEADPHTFKSINGDYGKDKKQVFYYGKILPKADPASFVCLDRPFSRDKNYGFSSDKILSEDGSHFRIIPNPPSTAKNVERLVYARDRHHVYTKGGVVTGADPKTFVLVPMFSGNYLGHDHKQVYWYNKPLAGADGSSFKRITEFHFKDKNAVWVFFMANSAYWRPIHGADVPSFEGLGRFYARDKNQVYYGDGMIIDGADPATFEELEHWDARDKNGTYHKGIKQ